MDNHFLQLVGTAVGTKAAPPYANLFMGRHEETIRETFICAILFWKRRFIDDIFLIFLGTTNQLQSLRDFMNHLQPHSQVHLSTLHRTNILPRHEDPHWSRPQTIHNTVQKNPLTARRFYNFTPTTHSSVKKALFFTSP